MKKKEALKVVAPIKKGDVVVITTSQDFAHLDTDSILRQRRLLSYQITVIDAEVSALAARIAQAQALKKTLEHQIIGLTQVIDKR